MKHCGRCDQTKPLNAFASDSTKKSGYMSHCKDCCNAARMKRYYASVEHERERSRQYYRSRAGDLDYREARRLNSSRYYYENRDAILALARGHHRTRPRDPERERVKYMKRHGGIDEWARMFEAQDGCCYLCKEPLGDQRDIHVDHDHSCCPGTRSDTRSCRSCRRGLAHAWCNQIIGLAGEDTDRLRTIIASFEPVRDAARARVAARKAAEPSLMPDLDMPLLTPWPQSADGSLF